MKIIKTIQENRAFKKTIEECKENKINPYDVVDPDRIKLHLALKHEAEMNKKNFLVKLKDIVLTSWRSRFGTVEQKKQIAADKEMTVSALLKKAYEEKLAKLIPSRKQVNDLRKQIEEQQTALKPDKAAIKFYSEKLKKAEEIFNADFQRELERKDSKIRELQNAYDLIRKPRGRLLFQEAVEKAHAEEADKQHFGNAAKTDVLIIKKTEAPALQKTLEKARRDEARNESLVEAAKRKSDARIKQASSLTPKQDKDQDQDQDQDDVPPNLSK